MQNNNRLNFKSTSSSVAIDEEVIGCCEKFWALMGGMVILSEFKFWFVLCTSIYSRRSLLSSSSSFISVHYVVYLFNLLLYIILRTDFHQSKTTRLNFLPGLINPRFVHHHLARSNQIILRTQ